MIRNLGNRSRAFGQIRKRNQIRWLHLPRTFWRCSPPRHSSLQLLCFDFKENSPEQTFHKISNNIVFELGITYIYSCSISRDRHVHTSASRPNIEPHSYPHRTQFHIQILQHPWHGHHSCILPPDPFTP